MSNWGGGHILRLDPMTDSGELRFQGKRGFMAPTCRILCGSVHLEISRLSILRFGEKWKKVQCMHALVACTTCMTKTPPKKTCTIFKPGTVQKRKSSRNLRPSRTASSLASSLARGEP